MNAKKATTKTAKTVTTRQAYEQVGKALGVVADQMKSFGVFTEFEVNEIQTRSERLTAKGERVERQTKVAAESRAAKLAKIAKLQAELDGE
jgi:hypothetical protein